MGLKGYDWGGFLVAEPPEEPPVLPDIPGSGGGGYDWVGFLETGPDGELLSPTGPGGAGSDWGAFLEAEPDEELLWPSSPGGAESDWGGFLSAAFAGEPFTPSSPGSSEGGFDWGGFLYITPAGFVQFSPSVFGRLLFAVDNATGAVNLIFPPQTGQEGKVLGTDGTTVSWGTMSEFGGTLTNVGLSAPDIFSVADSPVTGSGGTIALGLVEQNANVVWAGPTTGAAAEPSFRTLVTGDIPDLSATYQPKDADLTAIAVLTTTSFGRGFLPLVNESSARGYIGAGTSSFSGAYGDLSGLPDLTVYQTKTGLLALTGFSSITGTLPTANLQHVKYRTARVDAGGSDVTGVIGNTSRPFATVQGAVNAIQIASPGNGNEYLIDVGNNGSSENVTTSLTIIAFVSSNPYIGRTFSSLTFTAPSSPVTVVGLNCNLGFINTATTEITEIILFASKVDDIVTSDGPLFIYTPYGDGIIEGNVTAGGDLTIWAANVGNNIISAPGFEIQLFNCRALNMSTTTGSYNMPIITSAGSTVKVYNSLIGSVAAADSLSLTDSRVIGANAASSTTYSDRLLAGDDTAYNATSWNGNTRTPTKNAIRDKFETFGALATVTPGTGVATFLATPTLVNLKAAVTDETTVGWNLLTLANPGAITFLQVNADNTVTAQSASSQRTALGLGTLATQSGTFSGTSSGTNSGDQTITLTGDVTGSGTGSFATTISAGAVTNAMLAGSIAYSKLSLTGAILNADLAGSIAYSKLSLTGAILNADLAGSIAASKLVGTDIATLGTVTAGTWNAAVLVGTYGGTGVNNGAKTITLGDNLTTSGNFALTLTQTATTNVTLPTTGTLATLAGAETFTNKTITGGTHTAITGLGIRDTSAAFDVTLAATSSTTLTTGRTLTLDLVNAARTLKLTGNPTLADWFDQSVKVAATPTFAGLTSTGNVQVGTTASSGGATPLSLSMGGTFNNTTNGDGSKAKFKFYDDGTNYDGVALESVAAGFTQMAFLSHSGVDHAWYINSVEKMRLKASNGFLKVSSYGAGTLVTDASGNITVSSDERLKDIVGDFERGLDALRKIQPILYRNNKRSGLETEHVYAGFGARNVRKGIPEAVFGTKVLSLQDRPIIAALVNAVKELEERLRACEKSLTQHP